MNAIGRVVGVIEMLAAADAPMRLSDVARGLDAPKSAVHRILSSLVERGWVEQGAQETYRLTLRMPLLGQRMLAALNLVDLRQPILDRLAERSRELVRLTELRDESLVWIGSARGRRSGLVYEADMTERVVPFATANGKAWLATLPEERAVEVARRAGLGARPDLPNAVQTEAALCAELAATRRRGYGLAQEEAEDGVAAIAVTIGEPGHVVGTMSVAAPASRMRPERMAELVPALQEAARCMALIWHTPVQAGALAAREGG